jgi:hypothetical protein
MEPSTFVPPGPIGILGAKETGKPPFVWQRDIGNCLPMLLKNATVMTTAMYDGDDVAIKVLDTIAKFTVRAYQDSRLDHTKNVGCMSDLLCYVKNAERGEEVFAVFCQSLFVNIFAYLFGCKEMSVALPDKLDADCYDYMMFVQMFSMLPEDKRTDFLQLIKSRMCLSSKLDLSKFHRSADDYLTSIQKAQEEVIKNESTAN